MKFKPLLASVALVVLMAPTAFASFEPATPDEFFTDKTSIIFDAALKGTLKEKLMPYIEKTVLGANGIEGLPEKDQKKTHAILDPILAGERAYLSLELAPNPTDLPTMVFSIKMSDSKWADLIADGTVESYNGYTVYTDSTEAFGLTRIGGFAVIGQTPAHVKPLIDRAVANGVGSLKQVQAYRDITTSYLADRIFGVAIDYSKLSSFIDQVPAGVTVPDTNIDANMALKNIFNLLKWEGLSVAQTNTGYALSAKVTANSTLLSQWGTSLSPSPNFTPHLFEVMPPTEPILYVAGNNMKARVAWEKTIAAKLFGTSEAEIFDMYTRMFELGEVEDALGVSLEEIAVTFIQEYGFAVQVNPDSAIPYVTFMADVSSNRAQAQELIKKIVTELPSRIRDTFDKSSAVVVNATGDTANIVIAVKGRENIALYGEYLTLTLGISTDNKLILSNYPDVLNVSKRTGFANNADFAAYPQAKTNIQALAYFNMRQVWNTVDSIFARMANAGSKDFPSLENMQSYYKTLQTMYGFKDLMMSTSAGTADTQVNAWITIDEQKHVSLDQYLQSLRDADQDDDGISDYEELFLYNTSIKDSDCDNDGISDSDAISDGYDPCSHAQPVFNDIGAGRVQPGSTSSQPYYLDEVVALKQAGVVSGYPDGTFNPGKNVTRAEFLAMVMKGFPKSSFSFGGFHSTPFDDVKSTEWYATQVADAYSAGIVAGSYDKKGNLMFRPADPITRAEALMILSKASKSLKANAESECGSSPFSDVPTDAWFCTAVRVGKQYRITTGKEAGRFVPNDKLTRGEAAVMIRRTMELDVKDFQATTADVSPFDSLFNF